MLRFYPKMLYKVDDFDYLKVCDIAFYYKIKDFVTSFGLENGRPYTVMNGDSPSIVSYKVYGTTRFDYMIMVLNDIRNLYEEWPKGASAFNEYIESKYGSIQSAKTTEKFFYRSDGALVNSEKWYTLVDSGKYFETQFDYETRINDEKARIKLVEYSAMVNFEVELRKLTSQLIAEELNRNQ